MSLTRRLFAWLATAVVLAVVAAGAASWLLSSGPGSWSAERARVARFTSRQFAAVWADPPAREALAASIEEELQLGVSLEDAAGQPLYAGAEACSEGAGWRVDVHDAAGARQGAVLLCSARSRSHNGWALLGGLLAVILTLGMGAGWVARRLGRPLGRLAAMAEELGQGRWDRRAPEVEQEGGELGTLAVALNAMASQIEQQLQDQRTLLAAVSHELRTPLGHLRLLVELGRAEEGASASVLDEVEQEVVEMEELVDQLLASSRLDFELREVEPVGLAEVAQEALRRQGLDSAALSPESAAVEVEVEGDRALLRRAVGNLIHNAVRHGGGLRAVQVEAAEDAAWIWVEDHGPGLGAEELARLSAPFVQAASSAPRAQGLGLGLFLVQRIARAHGGEVVTRPGVDGGAVGLRLPVLAALALALLVLGGCADRSPVVPPPAASAEACGGCHATGHAAEAPWFAAAVYPELMGPARRLSEPSGPPAPEPGWSRVVPVDTAWAEWEVWQSIRQDRAARGWAVQGDSGSCDACHTGPAGPGSPHPTIGAARQALSEQAGVWVSGDTWRSLLRATVKVQNFGAGHQSPTPPGARWVLTVEATGTDGAPLPFVRGPQLPALAGAEQAGRPGLLYARTWAGPSGQPQLTPEGAAAVLADTRLQAWEHDELHVVFALPEAKAGASWRITARLVSLNASGAPVGAPLEREVRSP